MLNEFPDQTKPDPRATRGYSAPDWSGWLVGMIIYTYNPIVVNQLGNYTQFRIYLQRIAQVGSASDLIDVVVEQL